MLLRLVCLMLLLGVYSKDVFSGCEKGGVVIVSGNPEYPPISWEKDGALQGLGYTVINEMLKGLDLKMETTIPLPWKRAQLMAERGDIDVLIARESPERAKSMAFAPTPLMKSSQNAFFRTGDSISKIEDLKGKLGAVQSGISFNPVFDQFAADQLEMVEVQTLQQRIGMLTYKRIDYIIEPLLPTVHYLRKNKIKVDIQFIPQPLFVVVEKIAISKKSNCTKYLDYFDQQLKSMHDKDYVYGLFDQLTNEWDVFEYVAQPLKKD